MKKTGKNVWKILLSLYEETVSFTSCRDPWEITVYMEWQRLFHSRSSVGTAWAAEPQTLLFVMWWLTDSKLLIQSVTSSVCSVDITSLAGGLRETLCKYHIWYFWWLTARISAAGEQCSHWSLFRLGLFFPLCILKGWYTHSNPPRRNNYIIISLKSEDFYVSIPHHS